MKRSVINFSVSSKGIDVFCFVHCSDFSNNAVHLGFDSFMKGEPCSLRYDY